MKLVALVGTAGSADIDEAVAAERSIHAHSVAISAPHTGHADSPIVTLPPRSSGVDVERLVRVLDAAMLRGDLAAIAILEAKLGFSYADRFQAEF